MQAYIENAGAVRDALDLIDRFGAGADLEAAARACTSRAIGNHIHFCRWRQIERLILILTDVEAAGTVH